MMLINLTTVKLARMQVADLEEVIAIENSAFSHPWSKGNFADSLAQTYDAWVVRSADGELLGYFVQMPVVDEAHLLTIAVKPVAQSQGVGRYLLRHMVEQARHMQLTGLVLEVRVSNRRALTIYQTFGFDVIGRRKNYYEIRSDQFEAGQREDALILRYEIKQCSQVN